MASSRDRQRKLARAKLDRQMARRAATARRKRQIRAGIGTGLAVLLVVLGSVWLLGGFEGEPKETAAQERCVWTPLDAAANSDLKDVGTPATEGLPEQGTRPMTITTEQGDIEVELSVTDSPCSAANLAHLASKNFFDGTQCHELTERFLRCGDPSGTGQGGPTYSFSGEFVPKPADAEPSPDASPNPDAPASPDASASPGSEPAPDSEPQYTRGMVALAAGAPGSYGSQFVIFHEDLVTTNPAYSIVGKVTAGMDVLDKIVKAGTVDNGSGAKVKPAKDVTIKALTVGEVVTPDTTPSPGAAGSPDPTGSPDASGNSQ